MTWDVSLNAAGNIYASDQEGSRVQVFGPDGRFVTELTGVGVDEPFEVVSGIAINQGTTRFIVDVRNYRVVKFKLRPPLGTA